MAVSNNDGVRINLTHQNQASTTPEHRLIPPGPLARRLLIITTSTIFGSFSWDHSSERSSRPSCTIYSKPWDTRLRIRARTTTDLIHIASSRRQCDRHDLGEVKTTPFTTHISKTLPRHRQRARLSEGKPTSRNGVFPDMAKRKQDTTNQ